MASDTDREDVAADHSGTTPIHLELNEMAKSIDNLLVMFETLEHKIEPVLSPSSLGNDLFDSADDSPSQSEVANALQTRRQYIDIITSRISMLTARVEL